MTVSNKWYLGNRVNVCHLCKDGKNKDLIVYSKKYDDFICKACEYKVEKQKEYDLMDYIIGLSNKAKTNLHG